MSTATRNPIAAQRRYQKSQRIANTPGAVLPLIDRHVWRVEGDHGVYVVTLLDDEHRRVGLVNGTGTLLPAGTCDCDYQPQHNDDVCTHIGAAAIVARREVDGATLLDRARAANQISDPFAGLDE